MELQSPHLEDASFRKHEGGRIVLSKSGEGSSAHDTGKVLQVLIVDRDTMTGDLLASELRRGKQCHAIVVSPVDLLRRLGSTHTDLVVIGAELNHGATGGFDLAHKVSSAYPNVSMVILLNESTCEAVLDAFRAGARGVFSRQQPVTEFLDCVEHVRKGFIWAAERETAVLLEAVRCIPSPERRMADNSLPLTPRELQVVRCAARGMTNKAIAGELGLSEHTVKNYLFKAFEKLGVSNRVELLLYFFAASRCASAPNSIDDSETGPLAQRTSA